MAKKVSLMILSLCMLMLWGCESRKAVDTKEEQPESSEAVTSAAIEEVWETGREIRDIKEKYPEYFELNTFKGIELYVWQVNKGSYCCGMLGGTNRSKTDNEIWELFNKSVTPEEAKLILSTYPEDTYVSIIPVNQPLSSYNYEINDSYKRQVSEAFGVDSIHATAGELSK